MTINIQFRIAEIPNDMKMIAFLSGELGNSATYFSSFANVCNNNAGEISGTFGEKANNTWHSWEYSVRLKAGFHSGKQSSDRIRTKFNLLVCLQC